METVSAKPRRPVAPRPRKEVVLASVDGSADVYLVHAWHGARRLDGKAEIAALVEAGLLSMSERVVPISQESLDVLVDAATRDLEV